MTKEEARQAIKAEFMSQYEAWLKDATDMEEREYARKYGWYRTEQYAGLKDSVKAVTLFQKYIHRSRTMKEMEKAFGDWKAIRELYIEGWLSVVQKKWVNYYFISQRTAKEIWKEARGK